MRSLLASLLLVGVAGGTGCMWVFDPPEPPTPRLSQSQVNDVQGCQEGIHKAGRRFVNRTTKELERCAVAILEIRLAYENELISEDEYEDALERARTVCEAHFGRITKASTRFVDAVIDSCRAAEEWILDWDSLSFLVFEDVSDWGLDLDSVEDLAGGLCGAKLIFADHAAFVQTPRLMELLAHLGEEVIEVYDEINGFYVAVPVTPLDERCLLGDFL